jgi:hypothetical protein
MIRSSLGSKPYKFIGFGDIDGPKTLYIYRVWCNSGGLGAAAWARVGRPYGMIRSNLGSSLQPRAHRIAFSPVQFCTICVHMASPFLKSVVLGAVAWQASAVRKKEVNADIFRDLLPHTPYYMMKCPGTQALETVSMTCKDYDLIAYTINSLYSQLDTTCTADYCPQADWAGCILRFAGHDFMDYKDGTGGSDGCIDLSIDDNKGLAECLHKGELHKDKGVLSSSLADAYKDFCTKVSLADFVVIAAEAIMTLSRQGRSMPSFKEHFKYGRTTKQDCPLAAHRLPDPEHSCAAVNETFVKSMGLTWSESAALMGVHSLGRAQIQNSGYNGWWGSAEGSRRFDNDYYLALLAKGWVPEKAVGNNPKKNQWKRSDKGTNEKVLGKEMMLDTDMCLLYTFDTQGKEQLSAKNHSCCAWAGMVNSCQGILKYNNKDRVGLIGGF